MLRVIHQRQRLPLLLEPLQHGPGVHAGLDQLQGDLALDRLGLLGDPDLAHAAFADLLLQRVTAADDHARHRIATVVGGQGARHIGILGAEGIGCVLARGRRVRPGGLGIHGRGEVAWRIVQ